MYFNVCTKATLHRLVKAEGWLGAACLTDMPKLLLSQSPHGAESTQQRPPGCQWLDSSSHLRVYTPGWRQPPPPSPPPSTSQQEQERKVFGLYEYLTCFSIRWKYFQDLNQDLQKCRIFRHSTPPRLRSVCYKWLMYFLRYERDFHWRSLALAAAS